MTLKRASVMGADGAGNKPLLDDLDATIKGESDDTLRITGQGDAHGGGKLRWDMRLWPEALRADGNVDISSLPLKLVANLLPEIPWHEPEHSRIDAQLFDCIEVGGVLDAVQQFGAELVEILHGPGHDFIERKGL